MESLSINVAAAAAAAVIGNDSDVARWRQAMWRSSSVISAISRSTAQRRKWTKTSFTALTGRLDVFACVVVTYSSCCPYRRRSRQWLMHARTHSLEKYSTPQLPWLHSHWVTLALSLTVSKCVLIKSSINDFLLVFYSNSQILYHCKIYSDNGIINNRF